MGFLAKMLGRRAEPILDTEALTRDLTTLSDLLDEKIATLRALYDALDVPATTEQQIAVRIARATAILDTLDVPSERTAVLKSYFESLVGRNK